MDFQGMEATEGLLAVALASSGEAALRFDNDLGGFLDLQVGGTLREPPGLHQGRRSRAHLADRQLRIFFSATGDACELRTSA